MRIKTRPSILAIIHGHQSRPSILAIIHGHRRHYHQPRLSYTALHVATAATRNTLPFATQLHMCADGSIFTQMQG